jgi:hypothetical protein
MMDYDNNFGEDPIDLVDVIEVSMRVFDGSEYLRSEGHINGSYDPFEAGLEGLRPIESDKLIQSTANGNYTGIINLEVAKEIANLYRNPTRRELDQAGMRLVGEEYLIKESEPYSDFRNKTDRRTSDYLRGLE